MQIINKLFSSILFISIIFFILVLTVRGIAGNPSIEELNTKAWKEDGPFELSPERGRYSLLYSVVEDNSFYFSVPIAKFSLPDLAYKDGNYVARFAPVVSYLAMPGYVLGKAFGYSQVGAFMVIGLFGIANALLIRANAKLLGASEAAASASGLIFMFASPAFAYAVSLYQHHVSTFLILLSIYFLLRWKTIWADTVVWMLCAFSIPTDYPNAVFMFPLGVYVLVRAFKVVLDKKKVRINVQLYKALAFASVLLPLSFLFWFNLKSYNNPFQLSGTVGGVRAIDENGNPTTPDFIKEGEEEIYLNPESQDKTAVGFFETRNLPNGFYVHFFSLDRGLLMYTPILVLGFYGIVLLNKKNTGAAKLFTSIILLNVLLYSMWGDPYGGWAFGSRYLIPSYALLAVLLALVLTHIKKHKLALFFVFLIASYSIIVNTIGAVTSSRNPPQIQVLSLEEQTGKRERYTYMRNVEMIQEDFLKSVVFREFAHNYVSAQEYTGALAGSIILVSAVYFGLLGFGKEQK